MVDLLITTDMKPKILFIITKGNFGGAQRYVWDIASNITGDYNVVVATGEPGFLNARLAHIQIPTITLSSLQRDIDIKTDLKAVKEIITLLKQESPDIIHINSSKAGFSAGLAGRLYNLFYAKEKK